ncbi:DUF6093 family protein [Bifidobacterium scaligerum]|uniref:Phage associated protein n=1 Tax=Bifidobacterium scaligerum TaxID=2052656 RepID=A0A2M9HT71_9BIFI|nr:DUF6093 family protein [Bifidobacterium scaligerum]PJM80007.1 hypothetical protein CUU80_02410 [Bifidobacterium scaligerum]
MSIPRFKPASLKQLRSYANSLMTDECRIVRKGEPHTDADGVVSIPETTVYEGRCKLQTAGGVASENTEGGIAQAMNAVIPQWSLYLHLPYGTAGVQSGDIAVISGAGDGNLTGRRLRLVNLQSEKTHATAQRWNVKET